MAIMDTTELRRLRKKLRQIETLEHLPRELTPCEAAKVSLKVELRRRVEEILCENLKVEPEEAETKEHGSLESSSLPEPPMEKRTPPKTPPKMTAARPPPKVKLKGRDRSPLQDSQFLVHSLEGHSDLVTSVLIHDRSIVSGSWDTSVRVWDLFSASEVRTLCGHTGAVTCLASVSPGEAQLNSSLFPPNEHFVCSGSADCSIKVWSLISGRPLLSIYTFSAVSAIVHIPDTKLIISGSDILTRLSNHTSGSGFVDGVAVTPDNLLVASGFNVDQGRGFLNVRDVKTGQYLSTLSHPDVARLLCLAVSRTPDGLCRWVTGGRELLIWEELPKGAAADESAVRVEFCADFLRPASDSESEEDEGEDLWESDDEDPAGDSPAQASSWQWCLLM